jgi:hypothetical protein
MDAELRNLLHDLTMFVAVRPYSHGVGFELSDALFNLGWSLINSFGNCPHGFLVMQKGESAIVSQSPIAARQVRAVMAKVNPYARTKSEQF